MAPEVILGSGAVDARADVYAVGCVAYFLLTGQPVFQGSTPMEMLVAHVHTPPDAPVATRLQSAARDRRQRPPLPREGS